MSPAGTEYFMVADLPHSPKPDKASNALAFEVRIVRAHIDQRILMDGAEDHIDPDKWRPLIMNFCRFYGRGEQIWESTLAEIAESAYRPVPQMTR
jgi:hypothetical protein